MSLISTSFLYLVVLSVFSLSAFAEESFYAYKSGETFEVGQVKNAIFADASTKGFMVSIEGDSIFVKSFTGGRTRVRVVKNDFSEVMFDVEIIIEKGNSYRSGEGNFGVSLRKSYDLDSSSNNPTYYSFNYRNKLTKEISLHLQTTAQDLENKLERDKFKKPIFSLHSTNYSYYNQGSARFFNTTYSSVSTAQSKIIEIRKFQNRITLAGGNDDKSFGFNMDNQSLGGAIVGSSVYKGQEGTAYSLRATKSHNNAVITTSLVSDSKRVSSDLSFQKSLVSNTKKGLSFGLEAAYLSAGEEGLVSQTKGSRLRTSYTLSTTKNRQRDLSFTYSQLLKRWESYSISKNLRFQQVNLSLNSSIIKSRFGPDSSSFSIGAYKRFHSNLSGSISSGYRKNGDSSSILASPALTFAKGNFSLRASASNHLVENREGELGLIQTYNLQSEFKMANAKSINLQFNKSKDQYSLRSTLTAGQFQASLSANQSGNRTLGLSYHFSMGVAERPITRLINRFRSIQGSVFHDLDGDGQFSKKESKEGVKVTLVIDGQGERISYTDEDGIYIFRDIDPELRYSLFIEYKGLISEKPRYRVSKDLSVKKILLFRAEKTKYQVLSSDTRIHNAKLIVNCPNNSYNFDNTLEREELTYSLDHECQLVLDVMKDNYYYSYSPEVALGEAEMPILKVKKKDRTVYGLLDFMGKAKFKDIEREGFKNGDREYQIGDDFYFAIEGKSPMTIQSKNYQCRYHQFLIRENVVKYRCTRRVK